MELINAIELIPKRFYWMAKSKPPINTGNVHFFSVDKTLFYQPFASDFGPLSASCLTKYIKIVESKLIDPILTTSKIVHYCNTTPAAKSNSAVLAMIYTIISLSSKPVEETPMSELLPLIDSVLTLFSNVQLMPFRDASGSPPSYNLSVGSVVKGVIRAISMGYYNPKNFSTREYDFYEKVENGDMTWIIPKKILAFAGPEDPVFNAQNGYSLCEHYALPPGAYVPYFQKHNIRTVIRLNSPRYRKESFESRGIKVIDLIFPDGSCPTSDISNAFATEIDNGDKDNYGIAVHCKAGLGRTGTLIGMVLMTRGFTAPEAIGYLRVMRPGSVVGWQQNFMLEKELQCRRHELAVPKRLMVVSNKTHKEQAPIKQVKFMKKSNATSSTKQMILSNYGINKSSTHRPFSHSSNDFPLHKNSVNNSTHDLRSPLYRPPNLSNNKTSDYNFGSSYRITNSKKEKCNPISSNDMSPVKNTKYINPKTAQKRDANGIFELRIDPNSNVNKQQDVGSVYRISGDSRLKQGQYPQSRGILYRNDNRMEREGNKCQKERTSGNAYGYKFINTHNPNIAIEKKPAKDIGTTDSYKIKPNTPTGIYPSSRCPSHMTKDEKIPPQNTNSKYALQHTYIHLPNLHPRTPEVYISPQPRKNTAGRFVENIHSSNIMSPTQVGYKY